MYTTRHGDTNVLTKHTQSVRYAHNVHSHMFIHPYEKLCKQKKIHLHLHYQTDLTQRYVCTHAHIEEQSHSLTYLYIRTRSIDNTHHRDMQRYPYTYKHTLIGQEWHAHTFIYTVPQHTSQNKQWYRNTTHIRK